MKIKSKLFMAFSAIVALTIILGIISYNNANQVGAEFTFLVEHDLNVLQNAQHLQKLVVDAETGQRGFIITGDNKFLQPYYSGVSQFEALIEVEKNLVSDDPSQVQKLETISKLFDEWQTKAAIPDIKAKRALFENPESLVDPAEFLRSGTGKNILDQIRAGFKEFIEIENDLKDQRFLHALRIESDTENYVVIIIIAISSFATMIGFLMYRSISTPIIKLRNAADVVAKGSFDVKLETSGNDELSDLGRSFLAMTKSLKHAQELKAEILVLKKVEVMKAEFASMVTHELKTPLSPIMIYCELLKNESLGELSKEQLVSVNEIYRNTERLDRLIGDILDAQKLAMKTMTFNKQKIATAELLDKIIKDFSLTMDHKQIQFVNSNSFKSTIFADEDRITQIMENLIRNSLDFVPEKNGRIEVGARDEDSKVLFYVKDNGVGIPKDKQANLFKKFYQVDTSHRREHGGSGLGLVICKGIIENLGGSIWFESEEGKGANFYFSLPKKLEENVKIV